MLSGSTASKLASVVSFQVKGCTQHTVKEWMDRLSNEGSTTNILCSHSGMLDLLLVLRICHSVGLTWPSHWHTASFWDVVSSVLPELSVAVSHDVRVLYTLLTYGNVKYDEHTDHMKRRQEEEDEKASSASNNTTGVQSRKHEEKESDSMVATNRLRRGHVCKHPKFQESACSYVAWYTFTSYKAVSSRLAALLAQEIQHQVEWRDTDQKGLPSSIGYMLQLLAYFALWMHAQTHLKTAIPLASFRSAFLDTPTPGTWMGFYARLSPLLACTVTWTNRIDDVEVVRAYHRTMKRKHAGGTLVQAQGTMHYSFCLHAPTNSIRLMERDPSLATCSLCGTV